MSDIKAYLAEKYMSGPKADAILSRAAPKKKKRKAKESAPNQPLGGAMIVDEDGGWGNEKQEDDNDLAEAVVATDRRFKKRKVAPIEGGSSWITVQEGLEGATVKDESPPPEADEQPMVVDTPFVGGLVSAQQLKKVLPQNNTKMENITAEEIARAQETVYRDASGKKIDTKAARAEAARL